MESRRETSSVPTSASTVLNTIQPVATSKRFKNPFIVTQSSNRNPWPAFEQDEVVQNSEVMPIPRMPRMAARMTQVIQNRGKEVNRGQGDKRRCGRGNKVITSTEVLRSLLSSAITTYRSAEIALLRIMSKYDFTLSSLHTILKDERLELSFSKVKYKDIAPFVGLDHVRNLEDIGTFNLHRSRIPTEIFKAIVQDMDIPTMQHGPLFYHKNKEATSRFLAPIFNRLITLFDFTFENLPESVVIEGYVAPSRRIEYYFRSFGAISLLVVETNSKRINDRDVIAQVIAECEACDWNNSLDGFDMPVIGIVWHGAFFRFFKFQGTKKPYSFVRGTLPGDPRRAFMLEEFISVDTPLPFISSLRQVTEIVFDLLLCGYISSIKAFKNRYADQGNKKGNWKENLDKWEVTLKFARVALERFRAAESMRQDQDDGVDEAALEAQKILGQSLKAVPISNQIDILIMSGWEDDEIKFV